MQILFCFKQKLISVKRINHFVIIQATQILIEINVTTIQRFFNTSAKYELIYLKLICLAFWPPLHKKQQGQRPREKNQRLHCKNQQSRKEMLSQCEKYRFEIIMILISFENSKFHNYKINLY